jgi:hypothetical protein
MRYERPGGSHLFHARRRPPRLLSEGAGGYQTAYPTAPAIRSGGGRHVCSEGVNISVCDVHPKCSMGGVLGAHGGASKTDM